MTFDCVEQFSRELFLDLPQVLRLATSNRRSALAGSTEQGQSYLAEEVTLLSRDLCTMGLSAGYQ
jgi:hypothetical protein